MMTPSHMMIKTEYFALVLCMMMLTGDATTLDSFHCRAATCNEFYYGLSKFPRQKDYVNICHATVSSLQSIPQRYGKCFNDITSKFNPLCIRALAITIHSCISGLRDVPESYSRHYCGRRLMKNCAKHVGLERFPYNSENEQPPMD